MTVFDIDHEVGASKSSLKELCPAFLQQLQSGACTKKKTTTKDTTIDTAKSNKLIINWGG